MDENKNAVQRWVGHRENRACAVVAVVVGLLVVVIACNLVALALGWSNLVMIAVEAFAPAATPTAEPYPTFPPGYGQPWPTDHPTPAWPHDPQ